MKRSFFHILFGVALLPLFASIVNAENPPAKLTHKGKEVKTEVSDELRKEISKVSSERDTIGYIDRGDRITRAEFVQERMYERKAAAMLKGKEGDPAELGYISIDHVTEGRLGFNPTLIPEKYLKSNSENYIFPGGLKQKQLYTKTDFGVLILDEYVQAEINQDNPNMSIGGELATLVYQKHKASKWATILYFTAGDKFFVLESNKKLEGSNRDLFVNLATEIQINAQ